MNITPVELSRLIGRYAPVEIPPCRVCGAELTMTDSGGLGGAKFRCGSDAARWIGKTGQERVCAEEHYQQSLFQASRSGDSDVVQALTELRALRAAVGEDMEIAVGERFFPYGHGGWRCQGSDVHRGGDRWERDIDPTYTHDPTHQTLVHPEDVTE